MQARNAHPTVAGTCSVLSRSCSGSSSSSLADAPSGYLKVFGNVWREVATGAVHVCDVASGCKTLLPNGEYVCQVTGASFFYRPAASAPNRRKAESWDGGPKRRRDDAPSAMEDY
eukprot:tig00000863_g4960.t1